ncbi:hypothetical protein [Streptomyces sp. SAJ15]|uniref:hypothetical protein n=1 Tax=Streptomyces sp. SAJ15 TaxID=2011095 RepID=UPI0011849FE1|nr:hypothetical protein [Streptomyces sp. SAJ15]
MQAQMDDGSFAYTFDAEAGTINPDDIVDLFAPADLHSVTTVERQRKALFAFLGIADRYPQEP